MDVGKCLYAQLVQTENSSAEVQLYCKVIKVSVVSADVTISGKLFHTFTILGAKEI